MSQLKDDGLIFAYLLDGEGGGRKIGWQEVTAWTPADGVLWLHFDISRENVRQWLNNESALEKVIINGILADETRPRTVISKEGILQILRGVNHTAGGEPEDLVAVRLWIDEHRMITARRRYSLTETDISSALDKGIGPRTPSEFLIAINDRLTLHLSEVIDDIDNQVDQLEIDITREHTSKLRPVIADLRRQAISIRRYLAPQREALYRLSVEESALLSLQERVVMREVTDRVVRYIEDLDSARDKTSIIQEELASRLAEQLNKQMLLLSIVAVIFMPITFLSGLFGVNLKGIPGAESYWGFPLFCFSLVLIIVGTLSVFRMKKWI